MKVGDDKEGKGEACQSRTREDDGIIVARGNKIKDGRREHAQYSRRPSVLLVLPSFLGVVLL